MSTYEVAVEREPGTPGAVSLTCVFQVGDG
jgi:hypothetical protein